MKTQIQYKRIRRC